MGRADSHLSLHMSLQFDLLARSFLNLAALCLINRRSVQARVLLSLLLPLSGALRKQPPSTILQIGLLEYPFSLSTHQIIFFINKLTSTIIRFSWANKIVALIKIYFHESSTHRRPFSHSRTKVLRGESAYF